MSRYYDISIPGMGIDWTSHPGGAGGVRDPGALNVELDLTGQTPADQPMGQGFVRVWGVGLSVLSQAKNFANQAIVVKAGMGVGLPLGNPSQAGVVASGHIFKFFGNWEGVNQSIDLQISAGGSGVNTTQTPGPNPAPQALNGTLDWKKGQPLGPALQQTLQQMLPNATVAMNISSIVAPQDQQGYYANITELAQYIRRVSQMIQGHDKPGVSITPFGDKVTVDDATSPQQGGQISYTDLIGQPTWIDFQTISLKCIMRSDIHVSDMITMPSNSVALGQLTNTTQTNQVAFQGSFYVTRVRHVGNFRQPDGASWVTIIEASSNG